MSASEPTVTDQREVIFRIMSESEFSELKNLQNKKKEIQCRQGGIDKFIYRSGL